MSRTLADDAYGMSVVEAAAFGAGAGKAGRFMLEECGSADGSRFAYADGQNETLELIPPKNYWALSGVPTDYNYDRDAFCMPPNPPATVQLGPDLRAMVYAWRLREDADLLAITLETLSLDVVVGLLAASIAQRTEIVV